MPDKASNAPSDIVYSVNGTDYSVIGISRATTNPDLFSIAVRPHISCLNRQRNSTEKFKQCYYKWFNKHRGDFNNVFKSMQKL